MLENYFVHRNAINRIRASWIGGAVEKYVVWSAEQGYARKCILRDVPILMHFGTFAWNQGARKWEELPCHINGFRNWWLSGPIPRQTDASTRKKPGDTVRYTVEKMLCLVVPGFIKSGHGQKLENPFGNQTPGFFRYLREERGLKESTLYDYGYSLRRFADFLKKISLVDLAHLSAPILSTCIVEFARQPLALSTRKGFCGVLRVFLSYLRREGIISKDLVGAVELPRAYHLSHIPRSITWDEVRRVLQTVDRQTSNGTRDYAILLLLVTYGLRAHEVTGLTLDDIDWKNERLWFRKRKAGHSTAYPLSPIIGQAILNYLKKGRPKTKDRHVFFRALAPYKPIKSKAVGHRARRYLRKAGVLVPRPGAHTFRHTCVQRLVDLNFNLKTIGDYVGHRSPSSTKIYTKIDIEGLREVACGDGEEIL